MKPRSKGSVAECLLAERGSVSVEYTVLLVLVAMGCGLAVVGLGVPLVRMFLLRETWLCLPFP